MKYMDLENDNTEIFVVEDSPTQAEELRYTLERHGFAVTVAANGVEALDMIRKRKPTIVISDIVMPEMDGYELCREIKNDDTLKDLHVILLTSLSDPRDVARGLECGADNFINKPYDEKYMLSRIQYILANIHLKDVEQTQFGLEVRIVGEKYLIKADRIQILNLLLSSYETAVEKNSELIRTRDELRALSDQLEQKVKERTAALSEEIRVRMKSEEALRESQSFIRNILETVDEGFIVVDPEYRIISANRAFCTLINVPETDVAGRFCFDISHNLPMPCFEAGESCAVRDTFETGNPQTITHTHTSLTDEKRIFEIKSFPVKDASGMVTSVIETINDITEKRRLEEQLRQSQKMEALGTLVGGVAHDFNNIITAIIGFGSLAQMHMEETDPRASHLHQILSAADRAATLTRSLLTFCRKQEIETRPGDMNKIVRNVEKMLRRLLREDIEMDISLTGCALNVMVDEGQIQQVMMNLATNARDAMPDGGRLTISSAQFVMDEDFIKNHGYGVSGKYALLIFSDSGKGMDEETRQRVFEPFFTTKEVGKGTGLGLSVCYGIITQHNGYINCYSEPDRGTTIRIYLPRIDAVEEQAQSVPLPPPPKGDETILVAEDDAQTREITRIILENFGYRVIEATNGDEAVTAFVEHKDEIRLVIIDMIMPKRNGKEVYEDIIKIRPGVRALFTSGYPGDVFHKGEIVGKGLQFIAKPVMPTALLLKVRDILDKP
jgi:PAS domain S-box-containing protein